MSPTGAVEYYEWIRMDRLSSIVSEVFVLSHFFCFRIVGGMFVAVEGWRLCVCVCVCARARAACVHVCARGHVRDACMHSA